MALTGLVTLAQYKTHASITSTDATRDAAITAMIAEATEIVRRHCSRELLNGFDSLSRTEVYDGNDSDGLQLREFPVTSITSVTLIANDATTSVVTSTEYRVDLNTGVLKRLGGVRGRFAGANDGWTRQDAWFSDQWGTVPNWPAGHQNISVVYTGGYGAAATGMPAGLQSVVYRLIDDFRQTAGSGNFKSERIGDYQYTLADTTLDAEELDRLLGPYCPGVA